MPNMIKRRIDPHPDIDLNVDSVLLSRIYKNRNITDITQIDRSLSQLHNFNNLMGIDQATSVIIHALKNKQSICVVGDFDADGATSCALAIRALRAFGFEQVNYQVPNRFDYGYGLTPELVNFIASNDKHKPALIITVDNGISSIEGVDAANQIGIDVVVTDHHLPGHELPAAVAIVNPNQNGDNFPSKMLAGVGVMFYVLMALRATLRQQDWFNQNKIAEPQLAQWLDIVALGTVADVVPLDHNNRILVDQGLARIRAGKCIPGILALLEVAGRDYRRCVASDIGFSIAPRLNAAGRLEDMTIGIECLLCDNKSQAEKIAHQLNKINHERRDIEASMRATAEQHLKALDFSNTKTTDTNKKQLPMAICLYDEHWHQGVIGILASRIKEKLHRPVIAFAKADDDTIKGSARSISGLHIRDVLDMVAKQHPDLIIKFGGHAMAAGLSLPLSAFTRFKEAFNQQVSCMLEAAQLQGKIYSDGVLKSHELHIDVAQQLRYAGPWGQNFPEPVFDGEFEIVQCRIVGEKHLKLVLRSTCSTDSNIVIDAIAFNQSEQHQLKTRDSINIAYRMDVNEYQGRQSLQLIVEHIDMINTSEQVHTTV